MLLGAGPGALYILALLCGCAGPRRESPAPPAQAGPSQRADSTAAAQVPASPAAPWSTQAPFEPQGPGDAASLPGAANAFFFKPKPLAGCLFEPARNFTARYCAACHTGEADNRIAVRAQKALMMDSFAEWLADAAKIPGRILQDSVQGKRIMPPSTYANQPTDQERKLIADWVKRGCPNTPDGR